MRLVPTEARNARRTPASASPFRAIRLIVGVLLVGVILAFGSSAVLRILPGAASNQARPAQQLGALLTRSPSPLVVYSEFGIDADTIWAANPDAPTDRSLIAQVPHAAEYGIVPALSPDGTRIAYTALPPGAPGDEQAAELWVLDVASGEVKRLARGIDLSTPQWAPASDAIVVRRSTDRGPLGQSSLALIDLSGQETELLARNDAQLFVAGFSPDGAALYTTVLSLDGTDLVRMPASGGRATAVAHLSDAVARGARLSPDGTRVAYVTGAARSEAWTLALQTGIAARALPDTAATQVATVWEPAGRLTVGVIGPAANGGTPVRVSTTGAASPLAGVARAGFDVPLSWSPDSTRLAMRSFSYASLSDPGPSWVDLLGTDGTRLRLADRSDLIIAGWLETLP